MHEKNTMFIITFENIAYTIDHESYLNQTIIAITVAGIIQMRCEPNSVYFF